MQPDLPTRPWKKLGTDIFKLKGVKYLMIVDYYSRFPVVRQLDDMTAKTICNHFTSVLAEFGLPSTVVADFGPQYISEMFKEKCNNSGIALIFSSPYHHQTNSLAERSVGICKPLFRGRNSLYSDCATQVFFTERKRCFVATCGCRKSTLCQLLTYLELGPILF